jgi:hypothetical protein
MAAISTATAPARTVPDHQARRCSRGRRTWATIQARLMPYRAKEMPNFSGLAHTRAPASTRSSTM